MPKVLNFEAIIKLGESGHYFANIPDVPGCYTEGFTYQEVVNNNKEVLQMCLEEAQEDQEYKKQIRFPTTQSTTIRVEQISVNYPM